MKKQLCAVALLTTTALTATVQADDFTYLSGGLSFNKSGFISKANKIIDDLELPNKQKEAIKSKNSTAGFYLNGSVGFENNVFVEARVQNSKALSNYLLGVGYHYPVMQQVDVYGLVGVSKRSVDITPTLKSATAVAVSSVASSEEVAALLLATGSSTLQLQSILVDVLDVLPKEIVATYQDSIKPTVEIGVKARLNDSTGVQVAYRFAQFGKETHFTEKQNLHEGRIVGYYKVNDTLAVEAGYTYNSYAKAKVKDHMGQVGLRYTF